MDYRHQVRRLIDFCVQQHYDLIEITTSQEYAHRVINPSIFTNLLLLELNGIFPDTTPKVIETFKSELYYDGDIADFDKYIEDKVGANPDIFLSEELPKFNDISTLREAVACIFTFCRITEYPAHIPLFSISEATNFEDHLNFFLGELLSAQISAIEDLTYDSGYIFTAEQVDYTQYVLNGIYENTGRTKQLVSASDAFQEDLYRRHPYLDLFMSFGAETFEAGSFRDGTGCISKGSFPRMTCEHCGFDPHELVYYQCKQNDEDLTRDEWKEELEFYFYEGSHGEQCQGLIDENKKAESFAAPTGYNEQGPRPFYGNPRKMALDRWGNRRFIRRRKDGTYMKNVDVGRSLAMDRRRQSQTWAPAGYRDQGDGSPSLLVRLLDMFKGVDEEVLMAESYLMCADCDDYSSECGCHNSESDAYIYAYNDGHTDARRDGSYRPSTTDREITSFKKIFKQ